MGRGDEMRAVRDNAFTIIGVVALRAKSGTDSHRSALELIEGQCNVLRQLLPAHSDSQNAEDAKEKP